MATLVLLSDFRPLIILHSVTWLRFRSLRCCLLTIFWVSWVSKDELKVFLGILIVGGYNILDGNRQYWEAASDVRNEMVHNAMRRDRFCQIMHFLHFANNTRPDLTDKMKLFRKTFDVSTTVPLLRTGAGTSLRGTSMSASRLRTWSGWELNTEAGSPIELAISPEVENETGRVPEVNVVPPRRSRHLQGLPANMWKMETDYNVAAVLCLF